LVIATFSSYYEKPSRKNKQALVASITSYTRQHTFQM
jgi:hypothetical protein